MLKIKTHERLIIETTDYDLYEMLGTDGDGEEMPLDKEGADCLEDYLAEAIEDGDERVDETVEELFAQIKKYLKKYEEVQVVYKN